MRKRKYVYFTEDDLDRFFSVIKKEGTLRDHCLFTLAYKLGTRVSELVNIKLKDIIPNTKEPRYVYVKRLKNGRSDALPLTEEEDRRLLKRWVKKRSKMEGIEGNPYLFVTSRSAKRGLPMSQINAQKLMERYASQAKLPKSKRHIHTLRHTAAVDMMKSGIPFALIQKHLGHVDPSSTLIYQRVGPEELEDFLVKRPVFRKTS